MLSLLHGSRFCYHFGTKSFKRLSAIIISFKLFFERNLPHFKSQEATLLATTYFFHTNNMHHPVNIDSVASRATLLSFLDYDNDFSPFDANEPSVKHWESQRLFFQYPFPVWEAVARKLMVHARQLIPQNTQDIPNSL